jgi:hypothetical protein
LGDPPCGDGKASIFNPALRGKDIKVEKVERLTLHGSFLGVSDELELDLL